MDCRQYEITSGEFTAEMFIRKQKFYISIGLEPAPKAMVSHNIHMKPIYETLVNASVPKYLFDIKTEDKVIAYVEYRIKAYGQLLEFLKEFKERWFITYNKSSFNPLMLEIIYPFPPHESIPLYLKQYINNYEDETVFSIPVPCKYNSTTPTAKTQAGILRIVKGINDYMYYPKTWASALA